MKKIRNLICIFIAGSLLAACSYFEPEAEPVDVTTAQPERIDLMTGEEIQAQPLAPVEYKDVADVIHQSTDGRVEIFPLDDEPVFHDDFFQAPGNHSGAIDVAPVEAVPTYHQSHMNAYPGVEIFPLDDDMARRVNPGLIQYSNAGPLSLTPFPTAENSAGRASDFVAIGTPGGAPAIIYFSHDSTSLNQDDLMLLSDLARNYGPGMAQDITVAGHASVQSSITDPVQRKIVNLKISMDRAFAVARALIESGIPAERIETRAYGEARPPMPSDKPLEMASRRVEIHGVSVQ